MREIPRINNIHTHNHFTVQGTRVTLVPRWNMIFLKKSGGIFFSLFFFKKKIQEINSFFFIGRPNHILNDTGWTSRRRHRTRRKHPSFVSNRSHGHALRPREGRHDWSLRSGHTLDPLYCLFTCLMPSGAQQYAP